MEISNTSPLNVLSLYGTCLVSNIRNEAKTWADAASCAKKTLEYRRLVTTSKGSLRVVPAGARSGDIVAVLATWRCWSFTTSGSLHYLLPLSSFHSSFTSSSLPLHFFVFLHLVSLSSSPNFKRKETLTSLSHPASQSYPAPQETPLWPSH